MSDYQPRNPLSNITSGGRPGSTRVLLLLQNDTNRDHLATWLSDTYEVVTLDDRALEGVEFDLCILDGAMLERHTDRLQQVKDAAAPTFLPYLLVSPNRTDRERGTNVWEFVDEMISIPADKQALENRLRNLLERRRLSHQQATALTRQRELFRRLFESSNDAIILVDPQQNTIRECNPQACDLLSYSRQELLSLSPEDIHPDEMAEFRTFRETVLENGHGWTAELTCQTGTGRQVDAEISASAVEIDGRPHILASIRDVTTRTEQREVLNSLHDVTVGLMDATTKQDIASVTVEAARSVFGYDIAGVRLHTVDTAPETLQLAAATPAVETHLDVAKSEYEIGEGVVGDAFASGEPVIVDDLQSRKTPFDYGSIRSAMCVPLGAHGILSIGATESGAFDETNLKLTQILATNATAAMTRAQREQTLRERNESLSALFENATDCIVDVEFVDEEPRIRDVNPRFEQVFGYDRAKIRGEPLSDLIVPADENTESQRLAERALSGNRVETEARRETATGRRDFFIRVVPIHKDDTEYGAFVVYTDITDSKRRSQQLQVLNRVLRHNIRNKLNIVQGVLGRTLEDGKDVPDTLAKEGLTATDELLKLCQTARELSTDTRPENDETPISVGDSITRTVELLAQNHPDAKVSSEVTTERWIQSTVQLDRALREVCENAIEHCDQSTPEVEISCEQVPERENWIALTVADNGPGIPEEQRSILEKGEETDLEHSNGLGLWTVQWIVTIAGGELAIETPEDRGTVLTILLPTVQPKS